MAEYKGFVSHIIYRNEENGYTVFELTLTASAGEGGEPADNGETDPGEPLTCVGFPASIREGESCIVEGGHTTHPVYGGQLRMTSYRAVAPDGAEAVLRYLSAGGIKGIGEKLAPRIVERFGAQTLRIMEEEPERLAQIRGISLRMAREFGAQMAERKDERDALIFLQKYGIGDVFAARIWMEYGTGLYEVMKTNPYRLAEDIRGIGFAKADEIAGRIGIRADSEFRIRSGLLYTLSQALGEGHCFLPEDLLVQRTCSLLGLPAEDVLLQMENLAVERRLRIRYTAAEHGPAAAALEEPASWDPGIAEPVSAGHSPATLFRGDPAMEEGLCPVVEVYLAGVYRREQEIARMLLDLDAQVQDIAGSEKGLSVGKEGLSGGKENLSGSEKGLSGGKEGLSGSKKGLSGGKKDISGREKTRLKLEKKISRIEKEEEITLDPLQREAVLEAAMNAVLVITGGPGTGKTTAINTIIRFFEEEDMDVLLAAPTGRAARRMSEATGCPAMTIHRLLGVRVVGEEEEGKDFFADRGPQEASGTSRAGKKQSRKGAGYSFFEHTEDNPLEADVVIIDEMSMVDMNLFHALLRAMPAGARLVLVGDVNQLPSVGPGCVLQDLIDSGAFHTIMLRHVFRQASESDIVMNAHRILEGGELLLDNRSRDFFFLERGQVPVIYKHTVQLLKEKLPGYVGCRPEEIQVLTPMRRGSLGVGQLNAVLQSVLNPPAKGRVEVKRLETVFREGDKVMQTRNDYRIAWEIRGNFGIPLEKGTGIFNGDFGRIEEIDLQRQVMTVCFDDARTVQVPFGELDNLELAYAVTVHKAQGSEYPAVILPLLDGPSGLFNRNLLYTAVTRARKCVVILGSRRAVDRMIANMRRTRRYTGLRARILELDTRQQEKQGGRRTWTGRNGREAGKG